MNLYFLCDQYPIGKGEFFVDNEIKILASYFDEVYIFIPRQSAYDLGRQVPKNLKVIEYDLNFSKWDVIRYYYLFFKLFFLAELVFAIKKLGFSQCLNSLKIMIVDVLKAKKLSLLLFKSISLNPKKEGLLYSYWNDYKALSIALIKQKYPLIKGISRAHGWDVFAERQRIPYLPFKKFICSSLEQTYSISTSGMNELLSVYGLPSDKISVSRLGTINNASYNMNNPTNGFTICSCSNLIPLKRVHLIIEILSLLKTKDVHWIHFGDGPQKDELMSLAKIRLKESSYTFSGLVPNHEIIEHYTNNFIDLFINVSSSEGIPVSIMEAMSAGIPVIATNVGGSAEIVNNNNGFLIERDFNIEQAAELIDHYFSRPVDYREQKREAAYSYWHKHYNANINYHTFAQAIIHV
ncbi:glycosyltransferase [Fulvivirga lutea]|uniref:Glycosyltransferase n=1 Tax=Fulvivirga lutea TaxID=2810512 RepID=A0A974WHG4_9BACT|nr:glycosyltransferase [Fulvivirga lutea]QSE98446.1 glycosyltransferase [Fulvivirga lutea]